MYFTNYRWSFNLKLVSLRSRNIGNWQHCLVHPPTWMISRILTLYKIITIQQLNCGSSPVGRFVWQHTKTDRRKKQSKTIRLLQWTTGQKNHRRLLHDETVDKYFLKWKKCLWPIPDGDWGSFIKQRCKPKNWRVGGSNKLCSNIPSRMHPPTRFRV